MENTDHIAVTYRFDGSTYIARAGSGKSVKTASSTSGAANACRRAAAKAFGFTANECTYGVGRAAAITLHPEPSRHTYQVGHVLATAPQ